MSWLSDATGVSIKLAPHNKVPAPYQQDPATPSFADLLGQIQKLGNLPSLSSQIMPQLQALQGQQAEYIKPVLAGIDQDTRANEARAQSRAMQRGLSGSNIEEAGIGAATQAGTQAKAQVSGNLAMNQSNQLADAIKQIAMADFSAQRENILLLAQAMGQKISSEQELQMFHDQLRQAIMAGNQAADSALLGSVIGAGGTAAGLYALKK